MKKGIFLLGIAGLICFKGETRESASLICFKGETESAGLTCLKGETRESAGLICFKGETESAVTCFKGETYESKDLLQCRAICEATFKISGIEKKDTPSYREACQKTCNGISHNIKEQKEVCMDIYRRKDARSACQQQLYSSVQSIKKIHETIGDGKIHDLQLINPDAFSIYVSIDTSPLTRQIDFLTRRETKQFLTWLIESPINGKNPDFVNPIFSADKREFYVLRKLLKNIAPWRERTKGQPLTKALKINIKDQHSFFEVITGIGKKNALAAGKWAHNFIEEKECKESEDTELCILQTYCSLSETMSNKVSKNLMKFPYFAEFINNIIAWKVNLSHWSKKDFQSHKDLTLWHKNLCRNPV